MRNILCGLGLALATLLINDFVYAGTLAQIQNCTSRSLHKDLHISESLSFPVQDLGLRYYQQCQTLAQKTGGQAIWQKEKCRCRLSRNVAKAIRSMSKRGVSVLQAMGQISDQQINQVISEMFLDDVAHKNLHVGDKLKRLNRRLSAQESSERSIDELAEILVGFKYLEPEASENCAAIRKAAKKPDGLSDLQDPDQKKRWLQVQGEACRQSAEINELLVRTREELRNIE